MRSNKVILQNLAMLSRPAFVLESDAKTMPPSSLTPTQYVTLSASHSAAVSDGAIPETRMLPIISVRARQGNQIGAGGGKKLGRVGRMPMRVQ
jgi:hypothetical protein